MQGFREVVEWNILQATDWLLTVPFLGFLMLVILAVLGIVKVIKLVDWAKR